MLEIGISILKNSLSITFFVITMMVIIEYINVKTKGSFTQKIQKNGFQQILLATLLGILPGCFGSYTIVTLYTHNLVSFGALVANFIATMGDEAFLLFSMIPQKALLITVLLFVIGFAVGMIVDLFEFRKKRNPKTPTHFTIHEHETGESISNRRFSTLISNYKNGSKQRILLLIGILLIITLSFMGKIGHSHDLMNSFLIHEHSGTQCTHESHNHETNWIGISFIFLSIIMIYIIGIVSEHFLKEHFWDHIIKKHFIKILSWTTGVLIGIHILNEYVHIQEFINSHSYHILIIAILVGIIPESGPHVIFLSLYVAGSIPMSILLANSIVQDGHGALPLFAESKKSFVKVKFVNVIVAAVIGILGLQFGF